MPLREISYIDHLVHKKREKMEEREIVCSMGSGEGTLSLTDSRSKKGAFNFETGNHVFLERD